MCATPPSTPQPSSADLHWPAPGAAAVQAARERIASSAFRECAGGRVGLELELHLVDLVDPGRRPGWDRVAGLVAQVAAAGPLPGGSRVTTEPGGQVELSGPPYDDVTAAVRALTLDEARLREVAAPLGLGLASLGADPARAPRRLSPAGRYAAMEQHFERFSVGGSGLAMMTSTAALQVNLDAGPASGWGDRLELVRALVPVLVAVSSTSPWLGGRSSGWHSMRQGTWDGIDHGRSGSVGAPERTGVAPDGRGDPAAQWADYALRGPVMLVAAEPPGPSGPTGDVRAVRERVTLADWLSGEVDLGRPATAADVDYHLSTLFPPVRPRGYLEVRSLDALPARWWPAVAALTATLVDDAVAADAARAATEPVAGEWEAAARLGPGDASVHRAALRCLEVAADRAPAPFADDVGELAQRWRDGHTLSGALRDRIERQGPVAVLLDEARTTPAPVPGATTTPAQGGQR
ncbi:ergothioneine biosynthesis glutamate--cysteine ligase EgtA [Lapillicoccus jejuensis]